MVGSGTVACGEAARRWASSTWLLRLRLVQMGLVNEEKVIGGIVGR